MRAARVVEVLVVQRERRGMQLAVTVAERQQLQCDASGERQETFWHMLQEERSQQRSVCTFRLPFPMLRTRLTHWSYEENSLHVYSLQLHYVV